MPNIAAIAQGVKTATGQIVHNTPEMAKNAVWKEIDNREKDSDSIMGWKFNSTYVVRNADGTMKENKDFSTTDVVKGVGINMGKGVLAFGGDLIHGMCYSDGKFSPTKTALMGIGLGLLIGASILAGPAIALGAGIALGVFGAVTAGPKFLKSGWNMMRNLFSGNYQEACVQAHDTTKAGTEVALCVAPMGSSVRALRTLQATRATREAALLGKGLSGTAATVERLDSLGQGLTAASKATTAEEAMGFVNTHRGAMVEMDKNAAQLGKTTENLVSGYDRVQLVARQHLKRLPEAKHAKVEALIGRVETLKQEAKRLQDISKEYQSISKAVQAGTHQPGDIQKLGELLKEIRSAEATIKGQAKALEESTKLANKMKPTLRSRLQRQTWKDSAANVREEMTAGRNAAKNAGEAGVEGTALEATQPGRLQRGKDWLSSWLPKNPAAAETVSANAGTVEKTLVGLSDEAAHLERVAHRFASVPGQEAHAAGAYHRAVGEASKGVTAAEEALTAARAGSNAEAITNATKQVDTAKKNVEALKEFANNNAAVKKHFDAIETAVNSYGTLSAAGRNAVLQQESLFAQARHAMANRDFAGAASHLSEAHKAGAGLGRAEAALQTQMTQKVATEYQALQTQLRALPEIAGDTAIAEQRFAAALKSTGFPKDQVKALAKANADRLKAQADAVAKQAAEQGLRVRGEAAPEISRWRQRAKQFSGYELAEQTAVGAKKHAVGLRTLQATTNPVSPFKTPYEDITRRPGYVPTPTQAYGEWSALSADGRSMIIQGENGMAVEQPLGPPAAGLELSGGYGSGASGQYAAIDSSAPVTL